MKPLDSAFILFTLGQESNVGIPREDRDSVTGSAATVAFLLLKRTIYGFKSVAYHGDTTVFITKINEYEYRIETFSRRSSSGSLTLLSRDGDAIREPLRDMQESDLVRFLFGNLESVLIISRGLDNDAS